MHGFDLTIPRGHFNMWIQQARHQTIFFMFMFLKVKYQKKVLLLYRCLKVGTRPQLSKVS